jgi:Tol biopolymer transport system component/tRNA A-37 threonylcarbamoyl transferase component Bud32
MPPQVGSRLGPYELTAPIGAGGMGEVWRARDTRLAREIALKFLPQALAQDPDRLARFRREAQLLAALNHPNIAAIHGLEEADGQPFLVLELVEGEDLASRLKRGALPLDEALAAARQIAEALEEAHERGIVHRDLKPANVKVTPDGKVKVLDFGLAKAWTGEPTSGSSSSELSQSPTLAHSSTEAGLILGTAAYMSPEQARGKLVDKRSDVWAFGALLYELLTGRRLFDGETVSDVLAAVLTRQPEWDRLPAATPRRVRRLLERCLERDPKLRLRDIGEARIALAAGAQADDPSVLAPRAAGGRWWMAAGAGFAAALLLFAVLSRLRPPVTPEAPVRKLDLSIASLEYAAFGRLPALSPDGRRLLYHASGRLWIRDFTELEARELPDTQGAFYPCWSPDGRHVAYVQRGRLWTVAVDGGQPSEVGAVPADLTGSGGTSWSDDGQIVVAGSDTIGMLAIPAKGGEARELVALDRAHETDFHDVSALPGGRGFLYTVHRTQGLDTIELFAAGARRVLLRLPGESLRTPVYSSTGHILYRRESTSPGIWGVAFSLDRSTVAGAPFPVAPGGSAPSAAQDGSFAFVRAPDTPSEIVRVSRSGAIEAVAELPGRVLLDVSAMNVSADGRRAVVNVRRGGYGELWVCDLVRGSTSRLLSERADTLSAVWTPDGRVIFAALLGGRSWNLWRVAADGVSRPERLTEVDAIHNPKVVSPDGRFLVFARGAGAKTDLWLLALDGSGEATPWLETPANETLAARFSPDGRFLAYESDETGRSEVYVRPFPRGEGRWQVSTDGGQSPDWSPRGGELLYRSRDRIMSVTVSPRGAGLDVSKPRQLFVVPPGAGLSPDFRVSADGQRLLMTRSRQEDRITLVLNWPRELARLAAAGRDER